MRWRRGFAQAGLQIQVAGQTVTRLHTNETWTGWGRSRLFRRTESDLAAAACAAPRSVRSEANRGRAVGAAVGRPLCASLNGRSQ